MFNRAEITFLGTGTSIGVPVIGCDCKVCNSDDPKNHRLRSSILLRTREVTLVVDTGPDFRQQCLREGIRDLDAVIFTHGHSDHVMGFDDLRRFTVLEDEQILIFCNRETMRRLEKAYPYVFDGENRYRGYLKVDANLIKGSFRVGDLDVTPLPVSHGKVETLGFLFSSRGERLFAYIPDAKELAGETRDLIRDLDLLIIDGLQPKPHWTHLSIPEAIEIAQELEVAQTWLTHFSCLVDYSVIEPGLPDGIGLAWDGLKIVL